MQETIYFKHHKQKKNIATVLGRITDKNEIFYDTAK